MPAPLVQSFVHIMLTTGAFLGLTYFRLRNLQNSNQLRSASMINTGNQRLPGGKKNILEVQV